MPTIVRRPWVVRLADGQESIAIRPIIRLALTFDHRAVDGAGRDPMPGRHQAAARGVGHRRLPLSGAEVRPTLQALRGRPGR